MPILRKVFVAGGTGYIGRRLIQDLLTRGHHVTAIARPGSERKLPQGCTVISGNVLDGATYRHRVSPEHTFLQLTGVPHPSPAKARQFVEIDGKSASEAIRTAAAVGVAHFVYVSVAHPAPVMRAYTAVRAQCEAELRSTRLNATILRPWYVLGPAHYWPYALVPFYWLAERLPSSAEGARRLGLVTLAQMTCALTFAVENPAVGVEILEVPRIRAIR